MQRRNVYRLENGEYVKCRMIELKIGDIFKMNDPTGEPVIWCNSRKFIVREKPYISEDGLGAVHADPYRG